MADTEKLEVLRRRVVDLSSERARIVCELSQARRDFFIEEVRVKVELSKGIGLAAIGFDTKLSATTGCSDPGYLYSHVNFVIDDTGTLHKLVPAMELPVGGKSLDGVIYLGAGEDTSRWRPKCVKKETEVACQDNT